MRSVVLSLLLLISHYSTASESPLRFAVSESWSMPLLHIQDRQPTSGILLDIMNSLARQIGRPAEFHLLPRLRIKTALENGEVDIRCYTSSVWLNNMRGDFVWSAPILTQRDLLLASPVTVGPYPEQFDNEVVGTVLGYDYPALKTLFANHNLTREDARNQEQVLRKLIAGRYHYAVSSQLALNWINRQLPVAQRLKVVSLIDEQGTACIIRKHPSVPVQQILDTLQAMAQSGEIQRIVDRYTATP